MDNNMLIKNAHQILTMDSCEADNLAIIDDGWIYIKDGLICDVGSKTDLDRLSKISLENTTVIDASGKTVLPGFVDCHTHVVFGGSRVEEYSVKMTDDNPETLKKLGIQTGIYASVNMTRDLSKELLEINAEKRLKSMLSNGTTTVESKSGYGLTLESEIKMLEVNKSLNSKLSIDIVSTFLGAHGWTEGVSKDKYIYSLVNEMIPKAAERGLAEFNDIWCDEGHYTAKECEKILRCGCDYGLIPKIHTDAYSYIGGSDLAAEMNMVSADHLNYTPNNVLKKLKKSNVVGVLLPGIDFAVRHPKPFNPRPMINSGMTVALASNCCPGCWLESMQVVIILACRQHGFSPEEAIRAATRGSAAALNMEDRGIIALGKKADIQIWDVDTYKDVIYKYGRNNVKTVIKNGKAVINN